MAKIKLCFPHVDYNTDFMFSCAKKFNIKTETICYFDVDDVAMIEVQLESDDAEHLYEFCVKHQPECAEEFWYLIN